MKTQHITVLISVILLAIVVNMPILIFADTDNDIEVTAEAVENTETPIPSPTSMPTEAATVVNPPDVESTATETESVSENAAVVPPPTATPTLSLVVNSSEPAEALVGTQANLSIFGSSFSEQTVVRLVGYGLLEVEFINVNVLFVHVPANVPIGSYTIEVSDPISGMATSPDTLRIYAETKVIKPTPTVAPPTPVPGEPSLSVYSYISIPSVAIQGEEVTFNVTIVNRGNGMAMSPTASFSSGGSVIPSSNQVYVTLPNIGPNASHTFSITGRVSPTASRGLNSTGVSISYSDAQGKSHSASGTLTLEVENTLKISELTLKNVVVSPNPIKAGEPVILRLLLANTGTEPVTRLRLTLPPTGPILLPSAEGSSFDLANIAAGAELAVTLNVMAADTLTEGLQAQPFQLSYVQDGALKTSDMTAYVPVAPGDVPMPTTLFLESYNYGKQMIEPGDRFVFEAKIINLSDEPIQNVLVTFKNEYHPSAGVPSFFLAEGTGARLIDVIPTGSEGITVSQEFMSSGMLPEGIANINFSVTTGTGFNTSFLATVLVTAPPRISFSDNGSLPSSIGLGESFDLAMMMSNSNQIPVALKSGKIYGENLEVEGDGELKVGLLYPGTPLYINANLTATEIGEGKIILEFAYFDYYGQEKTLIKEFSIEVVEDASASSTTTGTVTATATYDPNATPTVDATAYDSEATATATPEATEAIDSDGDSKDDSSEADDSDVDSEDEIVDSEANSEPEKHEVSDEFWEGLMLSFLGLGY